MKGYVVGKGNQFYAVIYEGRDPITGRERRRWHPAGPERAHAEVLATELAVERMRGHSPRRSSLTVGVYLTQRWLPGKQAALRPSTWASYRRNVDLHVIPTIGRVPLRRASAGARQSRTLPIRVACSRACDLLPAWNPAMRTGEHERCLRTG